MDFIVFASICAFSFCYILFFDKKNNSRKKIEREIDEAIKKINESSVVFLKNDKDGIKKITKEINETIKKISETSVVFLNDDNNDGFTTKK